MKYLGLTAFSLTALWSNPSSPSVMEGSGSFHESGSVLEVTAGDKTVIHWNDFSIGLGETTRFIQPEARSIVLNRVVGPLQSVIDGCLQANGRLVLVNPSGIIIGPEGIIQAADFIASTYDILNLKDWSFQEATPIENLSGAINIDGIVRATGFGMEGGQIVLVAESVLVEGSLQAPEGNVDISSTALTSLGKESFISVDGVSQDAGEVNIWSDGTTRFNGTIWARGSDFGGNGGFVEVSGNRLQFNGFVDRRAPQGMAGELLLDPINITITTMGDSGNVLNPGGGGGTYSFSGCAPTPANIDTDDIVTGLNVNLNAGPVTINTSAGAAAGCPDAGTITITGPVSWTAANSLALIANSDISILASVSCTAAAPISITTGGALTIGSVANMTPAIVETNGQIDVTAATGMSVIGGAGAGTGDAAIRTNLVTSPLNITVSSGDLLISASTSLDDAHVGNFMNGGVVTINVLNGSLRIENNNDGEAIIGTNDSVNIFASQNIEFQSNGNGTCDIRCNSSTGNPSTVTAGVDSTFDALPFAGNYEPNFQSSLVTWNSGRDMIFTSTSTGDVNTVFGAGAIFNVGRNFYNSSMGGGNVSVLSNIDLTINVGGDFTIQNQSAFQSVVFANGLLDINVSGNVLIENLGTTTMLNAVAAGGQGVSIDAGGSVALGQDGAIRAFMGDILVIANQNISMGPDSAIDGAFGPGVATITLVVDDQAPSFPLIGSGAFIMDPTAVISDVAGIPVQIFTARRNQNSILGTINGVSFSAGSFGVDSPTEHWGVYYPDPFVGPVFTVFYKEGGAPLTTIAAVLDATTQSNASVFDLLQEFASPVPFYDDYFCIFYKGDDFGKPNSISSRQKPLFDRENCVWILIDNYRKYYPSLSRWEYLSPSQKGL